MKFIERVTKLNQLATATTQLGVFLCRTQRLFGDFHLKTTLGLTAAECFFIADSFSKKLGALELGLSLNETKENDDFKPFPIKEIQASGALSVIYKELKRLRDLSRCLAKSLTPFLDIALEDSLVVASFKWERSLEAIKIWRAQGPTEEFNLITQTGLWRDCRVLENPTSGLVRQRLGENDLRDKQMRAGYLCANSYLELASVDIVSDMISLINTQNLAEKHKLTLELSRQLMDECRHAELLAGRCESLGFELGFVPIDLHTWQLYQSFESVEEKLVIQQVLQEGMGLDASAQNILVMNYIGDHPTAELYAQITADEKNHVELGLRWAEKLSSVTLDSLIRRVQKKARQMVPDADVPIIPELRNLCGYPQSWLKDELKQKKALSLEKIHRGLGLKNEFH